MTSWIMADEPKVIPSAFSKTDEIGTTVAGLVVAQELKPVLDPKTKKQKTDRNGDPVLQMEVVILTAWKENPDDDGQRMLYVRGNLRKAIKTAIGAAGDDDLRNGARLTVTYTGQGKAFSDKYPAPKLYRAKYEPPTEANLQEVAAFLGKDQDDE